MTKAKTQLQALLEEKIDPVYKELAAKIKEEKSEVMPWVWAKLANLEQAKIMNALPASPEEIVKKLNIPRDRLEKHFHELFEKGVLYPGKSGWHLPRSWGGMRDAVAASNPKYDNEDLFVLAFAKDEEQRRNRLNKAIDKETPHMQQVMRVMPRWKAIENIPGVLPYEDVRQILKVSDPIVLLNCPCKKVKKDRACKDTIPMETCITLGRAGEYNLKRGAGRKISFDEAMKLFDTFDKYKLVHMTGNTSTNPPTLVCNCHNCCCGAFLANTMSQKALKQFGLAKSRFVAAIDPSKCKACRVCVEKRCPVGAAKMKQYPEFGGERSSVSEEECIGCGLCVITCPAKARTMKLVRPPEHIPAPGQLAE